MNVEEELLSSVLCAVFIPLLVLEIQVCEVSNNLKVTCFKGELIQILQTLLNLIEKLRATKILEKHFRIIEES